MKFLPDFSVKHCDIYKSRLKNFDDDLKASKPFLLVFGSCSSRIATCTPKNCGKRQNDWFSAQNDWGPNAAHDMINFLDPSVTLILRHCLISTNHSCVGIFGKMWQSERPNRSFTIWNFQFFKGFPQLTLPETNNELAPLEKWLDSTRSGFFLGARLCFLKFSMLTLLVQDEPGFFAPVFQALWFRRGVGSVFRGLPRESHNFLYPLVN